MKMHKSSAYSRKRIEKRKEKDNGLPKVYSKFTPGQLPKHQQFPRRFAVHMVIKNEPTVMARRPYKVMLLLGAARTRGPERR